MFWCFFSVAKGRNRSVGEKRTKLTRASGLIAAITHVFCRCGSQLVNPPPVLHILYYMGWARTGVDTDFEKCAPFLQTGLFVEGRITCILDILVLRPPYSSTLRLTHPATSTTRTHPCGVVNDHYRASQYDGQTEA